MRRPPAWLSWLDAERTVEGAPLQARLFLGAALPALAELWPLDEGVRAAAGTGAFSLGFTCLSGGRCALAFDGRRAWWWEGQERARLELVFLAAGQAVATFQERTTLPPLPVRGWQHLGDAARFQRATKRLAECLKPENPDVLTPAELARWADLQLGIGLRAAAIMARSDVKTASTLARGPLGLALFSIEGVPSPRWIDYTLPVGGDSVETTRAVVPPIGRPEGPVGVGSAPGPRAGVGQPPREPDVTVHFTSPQVAAASVMDQLDAMAAVNSGRIHLSGLVPLADHLNHVMERVSRLLR